MMKWTPFRVVLVLNLLVIMAIYAWPATRRADIYTALNWSILTVLQVLANLVLGAGASGIEVLGGKKSGVPKAFWLSAGLTLLISFPLCLAAAQFRS